MNEKNKHGYLFSILLTVVLLTMTACSGTKTGLAADEKEDGNGNLVNSEITENNLVGNTMTGSEGYKKALAFMTREYGFSAEDLAGID